jgi:ribosomal protein L12E/L44/L45/RPP1/RPP2
MQGRRRSGNTAAARHFNAGANGQVNGDADEDDENEEEEEEEEDDDES